MGWLSFVKSIYYLKVSTSRVVNESCISIWIHSLHICHLKCIDINQDFCWKCDAELTILEQGIAGKKAKPIINFGPDFIIVRNNHDITQRSWGGFVSRIVCNIKNYILLVVNSDLECVCLLSAARIFHHQERENDRVTFILNVTRLWDNIVNSNLLEGFVDNLDIWDLEDWWLALDRVQNQVSAFIIRENVDCFRDSHFN